MHAYLIYGGDKSSREAHVSKLVKKINIHEIDQIITEVEEKSIGIKEIREAISKLQLAPIRSVQRAWIIKSGEMLTQEAQQAMLKTLEEPPTKTLIYLCTDNPESLLPTITSRCELVSLTGESPEPATGESDEIVSKLSGSRAELLRYIDSIDKEAVKPWVHMAITSLHRALVDKPNTSIYAKLIKLLFTAQRQLEVNVNYKMVLIQLAYNESSE